MTIGLKRMTGKLGNYFTTVRIITGELEIDFRYIHSLMKMSFQILLILPFVLSCVSRPHIADEYQELMKSDGQPTSGKTVLVFLVDGLPLSTLKEQLKLKKLPQIQKFFLSDKKQIFIARTTFPSLTFPGISSLLTERPVDQNGIYGNTVLYEDEKLEFESPLNFAALNKRLQGKNILSRLKAKGLKTASFSYSFQSDSAAHMEINDTNAALAIQQKNYAFVDKKTIHSLEFLLANTAEKEWPDFIFIHLIGVDFLSHDQGAKSIEVKKHLEFLDQELANSFKILTKAEASKKREIVALMTADHGFDQDVKKAVNLEEVLLKVDSGLTILNEGRYVGLYFPSVWSPERRTALMKDLVSHPAVDIVAHVQNDQVFVQSSTLSTKFSISNTMFDTKSEQLYYPFFLSNLSHYFKTAGHPDAIIIGKSGVAFQNDHLALHGGPTSEEVFVPLLMHNSSLRDTQKIPALWELLQFL